MPPPPTWFTMTPSPPWFLLKHSSAMSLLYISLAWVFNVIKDTNLCWVSCWGHIYIIYIYICVYRWAYAYVFVYVYELIPGVLAMRWQQHVVQWGSANVLKRSVRSVRPSDLMRAVRPADPCDLGPGSWAHDGAHRIRKYKQDEFRL
jgi:hypothetical protein